MRLRYHEDMVQIVHVLLALPMHGRVKSLDELMPLIGFRFYSEVEAAQRHADEVEGELGKELQNGRLFRIVVCRIK
jgi:PAB-dependent poly(A)-specific ribonuclease subunit 3